MATTTHCWAKDTQWAEKSSQSNSPPKVVVHWFRNASSLSALGGDGNLCPAGPSVIGLAGVLAGGDDSGWSGRISGSVGLVGLE